MRGLTALASASVALVVGVSSASVPGAAGSSTRLGGAGSTVTASAPVRGLLVVEGNLYYDWSGLHGIKRVSVITLAGKRLPVPAPVRSSPLGLSPDSRLLARVSGGGSADEAVEMRAVQGGSWKTVIATCSTCDALSFAWSPDSLRLAATATPKSGPTLLRLFNRDGRLVRAYALPGGDPGGGRAYHRLLSWSPDGSRLLLMRSNDYVPTAVVVLDLGTGRLRTVATIENGDKDTPAATWSPNGRYVALVEGQGFNSADYTFAVIDAATVHPLLQCTSAQPCQWWSYGPLAWAPDSRTLFTTTPSSIDQIDISGHRTTIFKGGVGAGHVLIALKNALVYERDSSSAQQTLYLLDLTTGRQRQIFESRIGMGPVRPLTRIP